MSERRCGLGSILTVKCLSCYLHHMVCTSETEKNTNTFSINFRAAFEMIDAGLGEAQINSFLSAMNVPNMSTKILKKHEREVGLAIEAVAKQSCIESIRLEKKKTFEAQQIENELNIQNNNTRVTTESSEVCNLKVSFDAGWQKRGTGHSYNSLSGHSTVAGYYTGNILSYIVRCSKCRTCSLGHPKTDDDCRLNYAGSAKGMEPDMATELIMNNELFKKENVAVSVLIGADDSSTIAAVRRFSSNEIIKWSDFNHSHKSLTTALYTIKLSPNLIEYFSHCFSHAVKQNKGNSHEVQLALESIVPHAFGDHTLCGSWCHGKDPGNNYVHKNLPNGKPLKDPELRLSLSAIFSRFASNATKIANCGSTQKNESANNVIATKNPKSRHYSESKSLSFRVAASVCQINMGCNYASAVLKKMRILDCNETSKFRSKKDNYRKKNNFEKKH